LMASHGRMRHQDCRMPLEKATPDRLMMEDLVAGDR
jgi:hypothetical protein